jgi:hypothetical protein
MAAIPHPPHSPNLTLWFFVSKNEGTVPEIQEQLLTAPQAVPEVLPVVPEMLDTLHNSEGDDEQ